MAGNGGLAAAAAAVMAMAGIMVAAAARAQLLGAELLFALLIGIGGHAASEPQRQPLARTALQRPWCAAGLLLLAAEAIRQLSQQTPLRILLNLQVAAAADTAAEWSAGCAVAAERVQQSHRCL